MEVICDLCLKYQEGLLEDGDGSQVICDHCDTEEASEITYQEEKGDESQVICNLCLKYQEGLLEDGDGSQVICDHCDPPVVNIERRKQIERLCMMFLTRENTSIENTRKLYSHITTSLLDDLDLDISPDVGGYIEKVGDLLFNSRPGTMVYICTFLEFVCKVYTLVENVPLERLVTSAANVIERTNFEFEASSVYSKFFDILSGLVYFFR